MTKLPIPIKSVQQTESEKHLVLVRKVQETKQALDHSWQDLKRDSLTALAGAVSVYVGYRVVSWLFVPSKKSRKERKNKEPEVRYVEVRNTKKNNSWINMLLSRAGSVIVDIVLEKVQDNFPIMGKKDKPKERDGHS